MLRPQLASKIDQMLSDDDDDEDDEDDHSHAAHQQDSFQSHCFR